MAERHETSVQSREGAKPGLGRVWSWLAPLLELGHCLLAEHHTQA